MKFGSILSSSQTFQTRVRFLRRGWVPKGTLLLHVGKHQEMMPVWYAKGERPGTRAEATRLLHSQAILSHPSFISFIIQSYGTACAGHLTCTSLLGKYYPIPDCYTGVSVGGDCFWRNKIGFWKKSVLKSMVNESPANTGF